MESGPSEQSWQATANAVRKYYTFLTEVLGCLLPECVEEPPPEGWPNITEESLAGLEKTKAVIEVLRHLPYIKSSVDFNTKIAFATEAIDFREWKVAIGEKHKYIPIGSEDLPPHAIALTYMSDGSGSELILDTERSRCWPEFISASLTGRLNRAHRYNHRLYAARTPQGTHA